MTSQNTQDKLKELVEVKNNSTLLYSKAQIDNALLKLTRKLEKDYKDKDPIFVVVMNGGLIFAGKLLPQLNFPIQIDYCHATRYRGTEGGELAWKAIPQMNLKDRNVVIVDDILDEGYTLQAIIDSCKSQGALTVKTLVLIEKLHDRKASEDMKPDYCELTTPDQYIFGYGMDFNHYWRNLEEIYIYNQ